MKAVAIDYAVAATLLALQQQSGFHEQEITISLEGLSDRLVGQVHEGFTISRVRKIVETLERFGVGEFVDDPYADPIFQVEDETLNAFLNSRTRSNDVYARGEKHGLSWLKSAFLKEKYWADFDKENAEVASAVFPSVSGQIDLNGARGSVEIVKADLLELRRGIEGENGPDKLSEEDNAYVLGELDWIGEELQDGIVSMPVFGARSRALLTFIAKEVGSAWIKAAALALLALLISLVSGAS